MINYGCLYSKLKPQKITTHEVSKTLTWSSHDVCTLSEKVFFLRSANLRLSWIEIQYLMGVSTVKWTTLGPCSGLSESDP